MLVKFHANYIYGRHKPGFLCAKVYNVIIPHSVYLHIFQITTLLYIVIYDIYKKIFQYLFLIYKSKDFIWLQFFFKILKYIYTYLGTYIIMKKHFLRINIPTGYINGWLYNVGKILRYITTTSVRMYVWIYKYLYLHIYVHMYMYIHVCKIHGCIYIFAYFFSV